MSYSPEQSGMGVSSQAARGGEGDVLSHRRAAALQRQNISEQQLLLPKEGSMHHTSPTELTTVHTATAVLPVWESTS